MRLILDPLFHFTSLEPSLYENSRIKDPLGLGILLVFEASYRFTWVGP
jgi:hypothetical protein